MKKLLMCMIAAFSCVGVQAATMMQAPQPYDLNMLLTLQKGDDGKYLSIKDGKRMMSFDEYVVRQMVIKSQVKKGVIKVIHLPKKTPAPHRKHRTPKALDNLQAINQVARKVIKALV